MKFPRLLILFFICILSLNAAAYDSIKFYCASDTTDINALLRSPQLKEMEPNQRVAFFAEKLIGVPSSLKSEILEADTMEYTVNIHELTPLSLISTCVALAKAYETSSDPNWRDFAVKYESVMFKGGKATDFVSRFLYPSDWIADNIFRGNITDATDDLDGLIWKKREKSLYYISENKDLFKAFANQKNLDRIKMLEMGFKNHQIPYISNGDLTNPARFKSQAKDGDIFFLLAVDSNLDHRDMGILKWNGDKLMIIMLAPANDKVTLEQLPFENYVKRNIKRIKGARIIRISK